MDARRVLCLIALFALTSSPASAAPEDHSLDRFPGLALEIDCSFQCEGGAAATGKTKRDFWIQGYSDGLGNGNYPKSLTLGLENHAEQACLALATQHCGKKSVQSSQAQLIRSGGWTAPMPLACRVRAPVLSPYGRTAKPIQLNAPRAAMRFIVPNGEWFTGNGKSQTAEVWIESDSPSTASATCRAPIRGEICYGDCAAQVCPGGSYEECIATPSPNASARVSICGDALAREIFETRDPLSPAHWTLRCRTLVAQSLLAAPQVTARMCAAVRGDFACAKWVEERLRSKGRATPPPPSSPTSVAPADAGSAGSAE